MERERRGRQGAWRGTCTVGRSQPAGRSRGRALARPISQQTYPYLNSADFICTEAGGQSGPSLAQLGSSFARLKEI